MNVAALIAQYERLSRALGVVYGGDHSRGTQKVYPTLANPTPIATGAGAWTLGVTFTEVLPVDTITDKFTITGVNVESLSVAAESFEIIFYEGLASSEVEIGRIRVSGTGRYGLPVVLIDENSRISAKAATSHASAQSAEVSLVYNQG